MDIEKVMSDPPADRRHWIAHYHHGEQVAWDSSIQFPTATSWAQRVHSHKSDEIVELVHFVYKFVCP